MARIAGREREPRIDMSAEDAVEVVRLLEGLGIDVWVDGGWGVDALLGTQTRPHDDLDLVVQLEDVPGLRAALLERGYLMIGGAPPTSFELTDDDGRQLDVHPVVFDQNGHGVYRTRTGEDWLYPAEGFAGVGSVSGRRVRCLSPEVQLLCHTGYELTADHLHDVRALRERFGFEPPLNQRTP